LATLCIKGLTRRAFSAGVLILVLDGRICSHLISPAHVAVSSCLSLSFEATTPHIVIIIAVVVIVTVAMAASPRRRKQQLLQLRASSVHRIQPSRLQI